MIKLNIHEIKNVSSLSSTKRYDYFIKKVVDTEEIWGLYDDGWDLVGDGTKTYLPLWPFKEFANLYNNKDWSRYTPKVINIKYFLEKMIYELEENKIFICVFLTEKDFGICPEYNMLKSDLLNELKLYE